MPQKYQIELHDGRKFEVETDGGLPNEDDVLKSIATPPDLPRLGEPDPDPNLTAEDRIRQAHESLNRPPVYDTTPAEKFKPKPATLGETARGIWGVASSPLTDAPTRWAESISHYVNPESETAGLRGIGSAYIEGLGHAISGLTSPINLATAGFGTAETAAAKYGLPEIAQAAKYGRIGAAAPMIPEGLEHAYKGEHWDEKLSGLLEAAMGVHGTGVLPHLPAVGGRIRDVAGRVRDAFKGPEAPEIIPPEYNRGPQGDIIDVEERKLLGEGQRRLPPGPDDRGGPDGPSGGGGGQDPRFIYDERGVPIAPADINQPTEPNRPAGPWDSNISMREPVGTVDDVRYEAATRNYRLRNLGQQPDVPVRSTGEFNPEFQPTVEAEHGLPTEFAPDHIPDPFNRFDSLEDRRLATRTNTEQGIVQREQPISAGEQEPQGPRSSYVYHPKTNREDYDFLNSTDWQPDSVGPHLLPSQVANIASRVTGKNLDIMGFTGEPMNTTPSGTFDITPTQRAIGDRVQSSPTGDRDLAHPSQDFEGPERHNNPQYLDALGMEHLRVTNPEDYDYVRATNQKPLPPVGKDLGQVEREIIEHGGNLPQFSGSQPGIFDIGRRDLAEPSGPNLGYAEPRTPSPLDTFGQPDLEERGLSNIRPFDQGWEPGEREQWQDTERQLNAIEGEMNPDKIRENYNKYRRELEAANLNGDPNVGERAQMFHDSALSRMNDLHGNKQTPPGGYGGTAQSGPIHVTRDKNGNWVSPAGNMFKKGDEEDYPKDIDEMGRGKRGGIQLTSNVRNSAAEVTTGYDAPLPAIMVREGMQNALDAVKSMGSKGRVKVIASDEGIEIADNGPGMTRHQLYTVFSTLNESGKTKDPNATGGKGVGKASYMLGGAEFKVVTVAKYKGGQKIRLTSGGKPEDIFDEWPVHYEKVPDDTPTGTVIATKFKEGQGDDGYLARGMIDNILKHTRGLETKIYDDRYGTHGRNFAKTLAPVELNSGTDDKIIRNTTIDGHGVEMRVPKSAIKGDRQFTEVRYLNNGMYQFSKTHYFDKETPNMPEEMIINVKPGVPEGDPEYPFPTARESIKDSTFNKIRQEINTYLVQPEQQGRKSITQAQYDQMSKNQIKGVRTKRTPVFMDPGERLKSHELEYIQNSSLMQHLAIRLNNIVDDALNAVGRNKWKERLEGVGFIMDPSTYGIHIPNPGVNKSTIVMSVFSHFSDYNNPHDAAFAIVETALHEIAHIGTEANMGFSLHDIQIADKEHPYTGQFMQSYLNQVNVHGGLNPGHGLGFIKRMGEVYAKFGAKQTFEYSKRVEEIIGNGRGGYTPEIQKLLQIYTESRRRPATSEDFLSRTGDKSESRPGRESGIPGGNRTNGARTFRMNNPTPEKVRNVQEKGYTFTGMNSDGSFNFTKGSTSGTRSGPGSGPILEADIPHRRQTRDEPGKKINPYVEALNFVRTIRASVDLSAPFRQGLGLIHTKAWWTNWGKMVKAFGYQTSYDAYRAAIEERPLFKARTTRNAAGETVTRPSFAEEAGLKLTDINDYTNKEEHFMSKLAEEYYPGVKRSERAYITFLNNLRADAFESIIRDAMKAGRDPLHDINLSSKIADYVNNASGRGRLPSDSLENAAVALNSVLFSPRLMASRLQLLNPKNYIFGDSFIRKQYLKSALGIAGAWAVVNGLGKLTGGKLQSHIASADFGKVAYGKERVDPGGGIQQYLVLLQRMLPPTGLNIPGVGKIGGQFESTITGRKYSLGDPGFGRSTREDVLLRFVRGKTNPIINFGWGMIAGQKEISGKPYNFRSMNPMENTLMQQFVPMFMQDLYDVLKSEPKAAKFALPAAAVGMGTQTYEPR